MYIDFHTHILPGIDDGAKDMQTALAMLGVAFECGAEAVVLTPHISSDDDIEKFLVARDEKISLLKNTIKKNRHVFPDIMVGAEVALDSALSERKNVRSLCIEGTELILLELPYTSWNSWYNSEIYDLMSKHDVTPVMAHIERYIKSPKDIDKLSTLISLGVKFQVNASSFLTFSGRRVIRELAAEGLVSVIGSDCHNLARRSPDISRALRAFDKKFGEDFIEHIYNKTANLIEKYEIKN